MTMRRIVQDRRQMRQLRSVWICAALLALMLAVVSVAFTAWAWGQTRNLSLSFKSLQYHLEQVNAQREAIVSLLLEKRFKLDYQRVKREAFSQMGQTGTGRQRSVTAQGRGPVVGHGTGARAGGRSRRRGEGRRSVTAQGRGPEVGHGAGARAGGRSRRRGEGRRSVTAQGRGPEVGHGAGARAGGRSRRRGEGRRSVTAQGRGPEVGRGAGARAGGRSRRRGEGRRSVAAQGEGRRSVTAQGEGRRSVTAQGRGPEVGHGAGARAGGRSRRRGEGRRSVTAQGEGRRSVTAQGRGPEKSPPCLLNIFSTFLSFFPPKDPGSRRKKKKHQELASHFEIKDQAVVEVGTKGVIKGWTEERLNATKAVSYDPQEGAFRVERRGVYFLYCQVHFNENQSPYVKLEVSVGNVQVLQCKEGYGTTPSSGSHLFHYMKPCQVSGLLRLEKGDELKVTTGAKFTLLNTVNHYFGLFKVT
ncbi:tumor necrosis factor ligand superfamily member 12 [Brienomyrus brachyistius]|uniref:tumor necrosis factor ligand superfamily member 12 n=1 Tax=Brienomyrus brachyistius TaxID=42636 RepID=UPI0020B2BCBB|nr:tumor necrosis factor ligand superfamily member 12 [Brienomyrus brachyistius]